MNNLWRVSGACLVTTHGRNTKVHLEEGKNVESEDEADEDADADEEADKKDLERAVNKLTRQLQDEKHDLLKKALVDLFNFSKVLDINRRQKRMLLVLVSQLTNGMICSFVPRSVFLNSA